MNFPQSVLKLKFTSQCHPPRPTAFLTTPWSPTSTDFVRLLPVTTTLVWRGRTDSSSSELSPPQLWRCDEWEENPPLLTTAAASSIFKLSGWNPGRIRTQFSSLKFGNEEWVEDSLVSSASKCFWIKGPRDSGRIWGVFWREKTQCDWRWRNR